MVDDQSSNTLKQQEQQERRGIVSDALLNLAKQQKMNTDIRRSIFVILMSSEVILVEENIGENVVFTYE